MKNPYEDYTTEDLEKQLEQIEGQIKLSELNIAQIQKAKTSREIQKNSEKERKKSRMKYLQNDINKEKNPASKASKKRRKEIESDSFDSQIKRISDDIERHKSQIVDHKLNKTTLILNKTLIKQVLRRRKK